MVCCSKNTLSEKLQDYSDILFIEFHTFPLKNIMHNNIYFKIAYKFAIHWLVICSVRKLGKNEHSAGKTSGQLRGDVSRANRSHVLTRWTPPPSPPLWYIWGWTYHILLNQDFESSAMILKFLHGVLSYQKNKMALLNKFMILPLHHTLLYIWGWTLLFFQKG